MARLITSGAEIELSSVNQNGTDAVDNPDGLGASPVVRDTTTKRSGAAAWRMDGASGATQSVGYQFAAVASGTSLYARTYMRYVTLPTNRAAVCGLFSASAEGVAVKLLSSGVLAVYSNSGAGGTLLATGTTTLSASTWYRIELMCTFSSGGNDAWELRINGTTELSGSSAIASTGFVRWRVGIGLDTTLDNGDTQGSLQVWHDDIAVNDSTGGSQNSWPGQSSGVIWVKPASDGQRGSWTGGAGGTTSLFDAINNTPPVGVVSASATNTSQIESADSSPDNATDEYRGDCGTWTSLAPNTGDLPRVIVPWVNHGEDIATNTKTGSFGGQSNPAWTYDTFTFGNDIGAIGTYPTSWRWKRGTPQYEPAVTVGNSFILALRKTDTGTRVASVDALGCYIDFFTPNFYTDSATAVVTLAPVPGGAGRVTASGNEITDATRYTGTQGDGR